MEVGTTADTFIFVVVLVDDDTTVGTGLALCERFRNGLLPVVMRLKIENAVVVVGGGDEDDAEDDLVDIEGPSLSLVLFADKVLFSFLGSGRWLGGAIGCWCGSELLE